MIGHGLEGKNGLMVKRLNQHQLHVSLSRFQTISEKIDEGLKIFEINSHEDEIFANEDRLLDHIITVLKHNNLNRIAKNIACSRGKSVFHGTIF